MLQKEESGFPSLKASTKESLIDFRYFSLDTLMPFDEIDKMFGGDIFGLGGLGNISDTNDEDEK